MYSRDLVILLFVLAAKAAAILFVILYAGIGLGPDEAQYWTWSQQPDLGYYSKPPGIAWEIALGTFLLGNTEIGVRLMPLVLGFFIPLVIFFLAKRCKLSPSVCFWAAICMALSPLGVLSSFLAITDGGMVLCWCLACAYLAGKIEQRDPPNYLAIGILILCGALFKWTMYSFWLVVLGCWIFCPWMLSWKGMRQYVMGVVISLLALLPSVYWNATHEWATFRHVLSTLVGGHSTPKPGAAIAGNPLEFIGSQAVLVSPILFVLLVLAWGHIVVRRKEMPAGVFFCGLLSLGIILGGVVVSFLMKMQGNWLIFAYPPAFVLLAWYAAEGIKKKWMVGGVILSVVLCAAVFALPKVQSQEKMSSLPIPYRINPFRHNVGWQELAPVLTAAGYDPRVDFLFGDKYQTASILSFYGPGQKRAYFLNLGAVRKNQFSFWPGMPEEQRGKRGFFVVTENIPHLDEGVLSTKYLELLRPYFKDVRYVGMRPLFEAYGKTVKGALLFECQGYNGLAPEDPDLY